MGRENHSMAPNTVRLDCGLFIVGTGDAQRRRP